ncbi:uncharacterized protein LOC130015294 [Mercurialis annua]|uniref:uncharacterized protein LOC130015293 n=1 Tax=Mercurialis annua TaxID=3986 RepID=UPI0024AD4CD3|nr:uncharacterized protein LOC130015293 [Mercurialis annua]XP_055961066.1 uncharacterized protein LOC130015294 [Mercurialis annua]
MAATNTANVWRQEENPSSPYYVHPSENTSISLVSPILDGTNYHSWSRGMKMALIAKNKKCFIDGTVPVPGRDNSMVNVWERCNNLVLSWIYNSVSPAIHKSIEWIDSALEAWLDLQSRFSQGDAYRISDIQEELYAFKQNTLSVVEYYTHLKELWNELSNLRPAPHCKCNPQCQCGALVTIKEYIESDYVIRFLKGLNENFVTIKSQILLMEPLPKINRVFSMAIQHERQFGIPVATMIEPNVFYAKTQMGNGLLPKPQFGAGHSNTGQKKFYNQGPQGLKCTYCGMTNHTVDNCYKKHGYPPDFKSKGKQTQSYANQVESDNTMMSTIAQNVENLRIADNEQGQGQDNMIHMTSEEYAALMQQVNSSVKANSQPHVNTISTSFNPVQNEQGKISYSCSVYSHLHKDTWIVDSGATDHIICSLKSFLNYKKVFNVFVHLPNGQKIPVEHIGTVQLSSSFILTDALHIPQFSFNLISTSQLTNSQRYYVLLHYNYCFIQDLHTSKMIGLAKKIQGLYHLVKPFIATTKMAASTFKTPIDSSQLWHFRLGHPSTPRLKLLQASNPNITLPVNNHCDICHLAKQRKLPFPTSDTIVKNIFDVISVDIWGPFRTVSHNGHRYFLSIVDSKSRFTRIS